MNAIVQTLLHDPLFNNYFLGNGHHHLDGSPYECLGCAFTDVVADFNNYEKPEGFAVLAVLLASWKQIPVCETFPTFRTIY
jgi:ubiquitin carboxyl-terminal hydrolase 22/27/51